MNDWTDTDWARLLGTERLLVVRDSLQQLDNPLAQYMAGECGAELGKRLAWLDDGVGEAWWPLTDLERKAYRGRS